MVPVAGYFVEKLRYPDYVGELVVRKSTVVRVYLENELKLVTAGKILMLANSVATTFYH